MSYNTSLQTGHLPPDLQELVDSIMTGIMALAARVSNGGSNPPGVATSLF